MEVALARLVGAGLTLVFEGFEEAAPQGAVENGLQLILFIAKRRPELVVTLTEGVVKDIWREWRQAKLPQDVARAHVEALPMLMDRCRSSDGMMLGAVAAIQVARRIGAAARPVNHSSRVATAIIGRALETGLLNARGLNESIAFFFLDRVLARLMPDQQLFLDLRPLFLEYLDTGAWRGPIDPPAQIEPETVTPESGVETSDGPAPVIVAATVADAGTAAGVVDTEPAASDNAAQLPGEFEAPEIAAPPAEVLEAPATADQGDAASMVLRHLAERATARLGPLSAAMAEDMALGLRDVLARLASPTDADPAAADLKRHAAAHLQAGDLAAADQALGQSEDVHLKAAPLDLPTASARLAEAASTRACRAQIEELGGDFRRAARHYAAAARCIAEGDRKARRGYLMRQAGALVAQGEIAGETVALAEAAQVYADAGRLLSEQDAPLEWAATHLDLGRLLMELGEREGRSERFLAAALHFKPASDVFSRLKQSDNWARAQLGLADALRCQGEVQGDVVTLSEATFAYRAALGIATRDRMPTEWATANYRLALTLLRVDRETGEITHHDDAATALRTMLTAAEAVSDAMRCTAKARLAEVLHVLSKARGESWLVDDAINLLRESQTEADGHLKAPQRAKHDDDVASLLRTIGESRGSVDLMSEAAEWKLAALDHFQAAGQTEPAARISGELAEIESAVARLTGRVAEVVAA